ncbi:hypothetical protein C8J56DRAFT_817590 [Mycena floridula]|nr:hypothetical protein C8J56DRAFT_817590 [Mycena floridula]
MNSPSPPAPGSFIPRREFIREAGHAPSTFSLLAIASSNCLRLYSFPKPIISSFKSFFETNELLDGVGMRQDLVNNFCEFALVGKPWANAKSVATERLLVEIIALIYQHGYSYLSSIDYGRESDDRLALAFSKPAAQSSGSNRSESPLLLSPKAESSNSSSIDRSRRVPFALSFSSATLLRVVCPPLSLTPAILQAVRGSWPRGVVSEKKVGYNSFEFKLKGYKWFQEDTFATDSLRHILSLLSSLDAHAFSLVTSLSLTNRSRVKDLWIFTGPASMDDMSDSPAPSVLNSSLPEFKRINGHRRTSTEPSTSSSPIPMTQHLRATTEQQKSSDSRRQSLLRKAAPRAQVPVSVYDDSSRDVVRANLPSIVPEGADDMTGIGASPYNTPDVFYSTSPFGSADAQPTTISHSSEHSQPPFVVVPEPNSPHGSSPRRSPSPHILPPSSLIALHASGSSESSSASGPQTPEAPAELLGASVFRDSAFSSSTDMSSEVPIKWTGIGQEPQRDSVGHILPGGWQPTPIEEKPELTMEANLPDVALDQAMHPDSPVQHEPVQAVFQRVASPELNTVDSNLRKSEVAEIMSPTETNAEAPLNGKGWVLVTVEGKPALTDSSTVAPESEVSIQPTVTESPQPISPPEPIPESSASPDEPAEIHPNASNAAAAKAIVIVDAVEAKRTKSPSEDQSPSRIKRLLSLSSSETPKKSSRSIFDKLKRRTPEATVGENRRSIDG